MRPYHKVDSSEFTHRKFYSKTKVTLADTLYLEQKILDCFTINLFCCTLFRIGAAQSWDSPALFFDDYTTQITRSILDFSVI